MQIYIEGAEGLPTVRIDGLPAGLHYSGPRALAGRASHLQPTTPAEREGRVYARASFRSFRFDDTDGIDIVLTGAGGGELFRTSLADALTRSGGVASGIEIELVIRFLHGRVEVVVPQWSKDKINVNR